MPKMNVRPLTIVLVVVNLVCLIVAAIYLAKTAGQLPAFFPGHDAFVRGHDTDSAHRQITLAFIAFALGTTALVGATFTTYPEAAAR
jgi:hypothetical protein